MCARSCSQSGAERNPSYRAQRGEKLRLLEMAMDNARQSFASRREQRKKPAEKMLEDLRVKARSAQLAQAHGMLRHLESPGLDVVGSHTFDEGEPCKDLYRRLPDSQFEVKMIRQHVRKSSRRRSKRAVEKTYTPTCG